LGQNDVRLEVLGNGLRVLLCEARLAPVVELQVWAGVGSADERAHEAGLAHVHEHKLFKGTARRGVGDVAGEIEGAGGRINAYTSLDVTVYHATLPAAQWAVGIDVLSDAVLHSAFDPQEIAREIDVVLEEIHRAEDSPGQVLGEAVFAEAYRVHPYRAPILGSPESVASFDRARVTAFFERWYRADNLTFVAVGDFDSAELSAQLEEAFADATPGAARRERPKEPAQSGMRHIVCPRPFERANLELCHPTVGLGHADTPYLDLLAFVLGGCDSSRLVQRVKERDGAADRIDASSYTPLDPGLSSVSIETDVLRAEEAIAASVREIERLRCELVSAEELERARANFLASEHFERESVTGMATKLGGFQLTAGDYRAEARYLSAIQAATADDLRRVAREYLLPERLTAGAVLHAEAAAGFDGARIAGAVRRGVESNARAFAVPRAAGVKSAIHSYQLRDGTDLHVIPRRNVPVVAARAAFHGGLLAETPETSGITRFLTGMWLRGTLSHMAADYARAAESLAAEIDGFCGRNSLGTTLEAPTERLDEALALFAEILVEPSFDAAEIERERSDTLAAIERREDRLAQKAFLLFSETLYREHPYRLSLLGTAETVAGFDADAVAAHHRRLIRAPNGCLAVAGDVDPDEVAARLSTHLAGLADGPVETPCPVEEPPQTQIREAVLHKDRAQAHLVIGFRGLDLHDDDRFALEVISQLLAGQGGRLFLDLRDRKGLAYSVNAMNVEGVAPGHFAVYIATAPEKLDEARAGLLAELDRLVQAAPEAGELQRAKQYLIGSHAIEAQRNAAHAAHAALDALYGLGAGAMHAYSERVAAVSAEETLRVARRVIDLDAYTAALIRP
ncbi:MAG: M16 family metallopeptidase, partial [Myxococcota bacterium]